MNENYCSLEMARRLHKAGIEIETEHHYFFSKKYGWTETEMVECDNKIPRPTLSEVWRELPDTYKNGYEAQLLKKNGNYIAGYWHFTKESWKQVYIKSNPTDACCELLIWLKGERHD